MSSFFIGFNLISVTLFTLILGSTAAQLHPSLTIRAKARGALSYYTYKCLPRCLSTLQVTTTTHYLHKKVTVSLCRQPFNGQVGIRI